MKNLILLLLALTTMVCAEPYSYGVISDPDGWTNVRYGASLKSKVMTRVDDGEVVIVVQELGDFYDVLVLEANPDRPDSFGYIHKSRVKNVKPAEGAGLINDLDGWSNLRAGPSSSSAVRAKLKVEDGGFVVLSPAPSGQDVWYKVVSRRGKRGYLHGSRIEWLVPRN